MKRVVLLTLCVAGAASAQRNVDYGRPIDSPENRSDGALRGAARCVYGDVPASARKVLTAAVGSAEEAKRVKALPGVARNCFQPQWPAFPATPFRDAIAEATYREEYQASDTTPAQTTPPASFAVVGADAPGTPEQMAARQLGALANCTVFAVPGPARHWIIGPRNVDEEGRRFKAVKPGIERCGGADAMKILTARNFRGPVANALLERANRARQAK